MIIQLKMRKRTLPQKRISESTTRFNVAAWGRQSGKTTFGLDKMIYKPLTGRERGIYWYILQSHSAAEMAFNRYFSLVFQTSIFKSKNASERFVQLQNGAFIFFKSGKNYEDLRAETLDGAIIDEVRQQNPNLWPMVIRPMLARRKGWCDFYSTPNGFGHFYDLYQEAKLNPKEWNTFHASSLESPWWGREEIESTKSTMSEDEFAQEILAEFRELGIGKVYKNHGFHNQRTSNPFCKREGELFSPYLPIIVGLDFNVGLMAWQLAQHKGRDFYFADEISLRNTDSQEMANLLVEKVKHHPAGVTLIGDASGNARKTSAVGNTDYTLITSLLRQANIKVTNLTPSENPPVKDRVNCMNASLQSANGEVHFFYHPKNCVYLKKDLERVKWKEGATGAILDKSDPYLTHASDGAGYIVSYYSNLLKTSPGVLRVLTR